MSRPRALLATLAIAAAGGCGEGGPAGSDPVEIPPPPPVTEVTSFRGTSAITFAADPRPHTLEFAYQGPRRVRWRLGLEGEDNRVLVYRFGDHVFTLDDAERDAVELEGTDRSVQALQLELRRVLFQWPDDGLEWMGGEDGTLEAVPATGPRDELGLTLDAEGRPASLTGTLWLDDLPLEVQRYEVQEWQTVRGRSWPLRLVLEAGHGEPLWTETVTGIETPVAFKDGFYLPPGRDELAGDVDGEGPGDD